MATLDQLVAAGDLHPVRVKLLRHEFEDRRMYAPADFLAWLRGPVMTSKPFYASDAELRYQARDLLKSFIVGAPFRGSKMFKRMSPKTDDVYELRTQDIRIFGWFPSMDRFVAVKGDLFENLKADTSLYEAHRIDCINFRNGLNLNAPKFTPGAGEYNVISC